MKNMLGSLNVALDHLLGAMVLDNFEEEAEEGGLLTISHNASCVVGLVTLFRNAITGLMSHLRGLGLQVNTASTNEHELNKKVWYPDSRASNHVTSDLNNLHEATLYTGNNRLFMGNGASVPVAHIGSSSFASSTKDIKTGTILLVGRIHNGLYQFNLSDSQCPRAAASTFSTIAHTTSLELPSSSSLVFDLWYTWLYLVKHKSEALTKFSNLQKLVEVQIGYKIKALQTNWEGEFRSFPKFLSQLANMPMRFWAHAFINAAYLVNDFQLLFLLVDHPMRCCTRLYLAMSISRPSSVSSARSVPAVVSPTTLSSSGQLPKESTNLHMRSDVRASLEVVSSSDAAASNSPTNSQESLAYYSPVNVHPMLTRSNNEIFKPKVFTAELSEVEPAMIEEALASKEWMLAAQQEYDALLKNETCDLGRLVVKGYLQEAGIDFQDTFSHVVKLTTIWVVLALAVQFGWQLRQFSLAKSDGSLFIKKIGNVLLYVLFYVDDIIVTGTHQASIDQFVTDLDTRFSLKDLGPLNYFLGIEVSPTSNGLFLSQRKYVLDLLRKAKMDQHTGCVIENASEYRRIVGALQYVVITIPDITFAVNKVCQFMHRPLDQHFRAVKHILRYLQGTLDYGIRFTTTATLDMVGYSDANWGTDVDDRRSTLGFYVFLGGNPVAWGSKKQVVSRSTAEAEYRGLAHAVTEVIWLESLLSELHVSPSQKAIVWYDNSGAVAVSANPVMHCKFKHVELDLYFDREKVAAGMLSVGHVPAQEQVADVFTKPLSLPLFTKFRSCLKVFAKSCLDAESMLRSENQDDGSILRNESSYGS
ncbi:uncharacterized protein [Gossypium hirsutum]|uniref:Reverse transcriptase Ty1/copia-type domain-containing protein n=1 Tax=Gossypium hirsutum TaxID=3635 RepID=A0A1U8P8X1_GOSHI|nr:uncharacterized protein LOC107956423 [Gossypium hirsutum]